MLQQQETIAAIATAKGLGGVGMVRVSGPAALAIAQKITHGKLPTPRFALYSDFFDEAGDVVDQGLVLYFPAPNSFTGEEVIELHGHGGTVVLNMVLDLCLHFGARLARPGEFTQRAFLNDKMDLAQAESVADLIAANSKQAARMALRSLKGEFSNKINELIEKLIDIRMLIEASFDFPEEDIDFLQEANITQKLQQLQVVLQIILRQSEQGAMLREGLRVVIIGAPNVGKSSLLNALAGDEVAIVSDIAGTTRDMVKEQITLEGVPIHIVDTAGIRQTPNEIEQLGIARGKKALLEADLALVLLEPQVGLSREIQETVNALPDELQVIEIHNKIDIAGSPPFYVSRETLGGIIALTRASHIVGLSAKTGAGLDLLRRALLQVAFQYDNTEGLFLARERHIQALKVAEVELESALQCFELAEVELSAEHLRQTQQALSQITGEFTVDDLLGVIFSRFCIGK